MKAKDSSENDHCFQTARPLYVQFVMVQIMLFNAHLCIPEWIYVVWSSQFGGRWGTALCVTRALWRTRDLPMCGRVGVGTSVRSRNSLTGGVARWA